MFMETIKMRVFLGFFMVGVLAVSLFAASAAQAAGDPVDAFQYRLKIMSSLSAHIGSIADVLKGKVAYTDHIVGHARALQAAGRMLEDVFPPGSDVGETRSKPEIWQQPEKFKAAMQAFQTATDGLVAAAESGDMGAIGNALGPVGKGCGGCHKPFRKPKE